jgi:hypothetical protein
MSPLQCQKNIRLQEARRLLLVENLNAHEAAEKVSYEDAFRELVLARDYKYHLLFVECPTDKAFQPRFAPGDTFAIPVPSKVKARVWSSRLERPRDCRKHK